MLVPEHRVHSLLLIQIRSKRCISSCPVRLLEASPSPLVNTHLTELLQNKTIYYNTD